MFKSIYKLSFYKHKKVNFVFQVCRTMYQQENVLKECEIMCDMKKIFVDSVASVNPSILIKNTVSVDEEKRVLRILQDNVSFNSNVYLVGFGKGVLGMAAECVHILGSNLKAGILSVPVGSCEKFGENALEDKLVIFEGAENNLPDENAMLAAKEIYNLASNLNGDDLLLVLITGGGSALLPMPVPDISLCDKINTIKLLNSVGADITELNTVRKKLSILKGGGLAEIAYPCRVISLILSDIMHDPLDLIASGSTVLNTDSQYAAFDVIQKYRLDFKIPKHVLNAVRSENVHTSIPLVHNKYGHVKNYIIGNNLIALKHAVNTAEDLNFKCAILSDAVCGFVHNVASFFAKLSLELCKIIHSGNDRSINEILNDIKHYNELFFEINHTFATQLLNKLQQFSKSNGLCIVSGGEITVHINGPGKGGRNQELALIFSQYIYTLQKENDILNNFEVYLLSAGTDGIDGPTDVAGAFGCDKVITDANDIGLNADEYLAQSDSYNFYSRLYNGKYLIKTGHTGTNVMDIYMLVIKRKDIGVHSSL